MRAVADICTVVDSVHAKHGLAFYDFPVERIHLRTTRPVDSTSATVRLRTKVNKGAGSQAVALAMVFKLVESAQDRWRAVPPPRRPGASRRPLQNAGSSSSGRKSEPHDCLSYRPGGP